MKRYSYSDDVLRSILESTKTIAVVGASANSERPVYHVMEFLMERGYCIYPVNPGLAGQQLFGRTVYASLSAIQQPVDMVDLFINSERTGIVVDEALSLPVRPQIIWMQLNIWNDSAAERAAASNIKVVMDRCVQQESIRLSVPAKTDKVIC